MPFPLTDAQLNTLLDEIPAVAGRPRQLEELSGGLTNRNVKVTTPDAVYVARCTDTSCNFLAIDRDEEYYNSVAAERAGVGAPVIDYRPDLGILLLGFLNGKTLCNEDFQRPGGDGQGGRGMPGIALRAPVSRPVRHVRAPAPIPENRPGQRLQDPATTTWTTPTRSPRSRRALTATDQTTVPCNNDLLAGNFIEDGDRVWIIDYEYSGNNDPCFELGNIWSECGLSTEQLDELVTTLLRPSAAAQDRPRPPAGHRRQVRLDAVGLHPKCLQRT